MKKKEIQLMIENHAGRITNLITGTFKHDERLIDLLSIYPVNWLFSRKLYHFLNDNITSICSQCQIKELKFYGLKAGYAKYCSLKCRSSDPKYYQRARESNMKKYGVAYASQSTIFRDRVKTTCIEKYGVDNPMKDKNVQQTLKNSLMKKYGVENFAKHDDFKQKSYNTRLKNGSIVPKEDKSKYNLFYEEVKSVTERSYYDHYYQINPEKLLRGKNTYHLDHIYSIAEGFKNNVDPKIIGHWTNLRILSASINIKKNYHCDKTLDELYEDYNSSN